MPGALSHQLDCSSTELALSYPWPGGLHADGPWLDQPAFSPSRGSASAIGSGGRMITDEACTVTLASQPVRTS